MIHISILDGLLYKFAHILWDNYVKTVTFADREELISRQTQFTSVIEQAIKQVLHIKNKGN